MRKITRLCEQLTPAQRERVLGYAAALAHHSAAVSALPARSEQQCEDILAIIEESDQHKNATERD